MTYANVHFVLLVGVHLCGADASLWVQVTLVRGVMLEEVGRCRYLSFVFANVVARNKGQGSGTSTSWPFGQQGCDREQLSCYVWLCRLSTAGDWTSEKLGRVLQSLPDNTQQRRLVAQMGQFAKSKLWMKGVMPLNSRDVISLYRPR
jgi:hypothetical protein